MERQRCATTRSSTKYAKNTELNLRIPNHICRGRTDVRMSSAYYQRSSKQEGLGGESRNAFGTSTSYGKRRYTHEQFIEIIAPSRCISFGMLTCWIKDKSLSPACALLRMGYANTAPLPSVKICVHALPRREVPIFENIVSV